MRLVTKADIDAAADRIGDAVFRTPLVPITFPGHERPCWVKAENLQPTGSFKIRGAHSAIRALDADARNRGIVSYSSGNHALAVAHAARNTGIPALIVVDDTAPALKVAATRALGAEVVVAKPDVRADVAERLATERGATLVPPFDHRLVIAGQGTIGVEIIDELSTVDVVLVPISGGGLASGVSVAIKSIRPDVRVYGVEPELAADAQESIAVGQLVHWPAEKRLTTIADGLRAQPSELTFAHLRTFLDGVVTVTEAEIRSAVASLARHARLVAEPSGAATTAAYLYCADQLPAGRTVAVLTGGNIEPTLLASILTESPSR
jgi:threonine dehydratase